MEIRDFAIQILSATTLEEKLTTPQELTDLAPGAALRWDEPSRPSGMEFRRRTQEEKLPPFHQHHDVDKRAVCLHRFAGHELLAVEIMAFALLAFPEAPGRFRRGLAHTLQEEQEHVKLYIQRLNELGVAFGDMPLYRHFWMHTPYLQSPLQYVSMMSLTFEMANLDFAPLYGKSFERVGDIPSSQLMQRIFTDEIAHVRFGWRWLTQMKQQQLSDWEAWQQALPEKIDPKRARGFILSEEPRLEAGVSQEWINTLKQL